MKVAIGLLADPSAGGWPTFTAHLMHGFLDAGMKPLLFKVGNKTERNTRDFGRGFSYQNLSLTDAINVTRQMPTFLAAVGPKHTEEASVLLQNNAAIIIHDPTEVTPVMREALSKSKQPIIIDRKVNAQHLQEYDVAEILHPYKRNNSMSYRRKWHGVAYSRLDWDKKTHVIVEANTLLPADKQIRIHGAENRLYTHHKVAEIDADWKRNYEGGWPAKSSLWYGALLAARAKHVIDLSVIKGDGGGTQYSFLEAFDAGTPLIIHNDWLTGNPSLDEIAPAVAATVTGAEELANVLTETNISNNTDAAETILNNHNAALQAVTLMKHIGVNT